MSLGSAMIKYNLKELLAKKEFEEKRRIPMSEVARETGISRTTLSKIANSRGDYSTRTECIEKLCRFFGCSPEELMTII